MKRYRLELGWDDGIQPGGLVATIASEAGLEGRQIGTINIQETHAFVDLPQDLPLDVVESLGQTKVRGKALRLSPAAFTPPTRGLAGGADRPNKPGRPNKFVARGKKGPYKAGPGTKADKPFKTGKPFKPGKKPKPAAARPATE